MGLARRVALPSLRIDRARERAVQTRLILVAERALEVRLAQAMAAAGRRAAAAHQERHGIAGAIAGLPAELARILRASLIEIARQLGRRVVQAPKNASAFPLEAKAFGDLDQAIAEHVGRDAASRVAGISDTLRDSIARVVERGIAEGVGQDELARRIRDATGGEIGLARARRVARTEVHNAAMYGQQAAAEASPLAFEKVWLATEDHRTRQSHADANDQRVPLDEPFVLASRTGDVRLMYPGDTQGPPHETINCRCVVAYEPLPELKPAAGGRGEPAGRVTEIDLEIIEPEPLADMTPEDAPRQRLLPRAPSGTMPERPGSATDLPLSTVTDLRDIFGPGVDPEPSDPEPIEIVDEVPAVPVDLAPAPEPEAPVGLVDRMLAQSASRRVGEALAVVMDRDGASPSAIANDLAVELALDAAQAAPGSVTIDQLRDAADDLQATRWSRLRLRDFLDELLADLTETL